MYSSFSQQHRQYPRRSQVKSLSTKKLNDIKVCASTGVYYYRYPYKIKLKQGSVQPDYYRRVRDAVFQRLMYEEFIDLECKEGTRIQIGQEKKFIYFRSYTDLEIVADFFHSDIEEITGPINEEHISILLHPDQKCVLRAPYYKKYDSKVYVGINYKGNAFANFWSNKLYGNRQERNRIVGDAVTYCRDNIPEDHFRSLRGYLSSHEFYTNYEQFEELTPFLTLQFPDARFYVTRCLYK